MYIIKDIVRGKSPILTENMEPNIFAKIVALNIFCQAQRKNIAQDAVR